MCSSRGYPYPHGGQQNSEGRRGPKGGNFQGRGGGGGTYRGFSPVGLSKIAELLTNNNTLNIGIKSHLLGD